MHVWKRVYKWVPIYIVSQKDAYLIENVPCPGFAYITRNTSVAKVSVDSFSDIQTYTVENIRMLYNWVVERYHRDGISLT